MNYAEAEYQRRVKYDFPDYQGKMFDYEYKTDFDGCIVYPLFYGCKDVYPAYHVNSACWAAHSFLVNSDVISKGVPIFFYIEEMLREKATEQLTHLGIPKTRMIYWKAPPRHPDYHGQFLAQKLYILADDRFLAFKNVIVPDTDLFLSTNGNDRYPIEKLWHRKDRTKYATWGISEGLERGPRTYLYYGLDHESSTELWKGIVKKHLRLETDMVHRSEGALNAFDLRHLDQDFIDFTQRYAKLFGSEEDTNSLYMQYREMRHEDLSDTWDIPMTRTVPDIKNYPAEFFFIHTRPKRMPDPKDVEDYRHLIGQYKEVE